MLIHRVPQELIDHIIDDIESDYASFESDAQMKVKRDQVLRLCGSISKKFRHRVSIHLFSDITLYIFPDNPSPLAKYSQALRLVLEETPYLAACVQKLTLELATTPGTKYDAITFSDEDLSRVLDMLISLWSLKLSSQNKECNWSKFEPVLRAAFFKLQSSHLIKVLHISGDDLQIPPDILVHWTSLTELSFNQQAMLILANELVPWEILWQEVPRLETLSIFSVGIDAMLTILLPLLGTYKWQLLTYLKFLVVDFTDPKEFSLIECFILRMAKRLEKVTFVDLFSLTPMKMFFFYSPRDPLGYLNLRTVVIKENSFKPKETQMAIANSIATFASYCPNLEHLRLLPLSWYFSDINEDLHMDWELKQFDSSNWAQLDDVLSTLKSFKSLWVALDFHYTEEEWKQRVNQHLVDEVRNCLGSSVLFPQLWKSVKQNGKDGTVRVGVWFSRDDLTDSEGPKDIIFGNAPEW